MDEFTNEVRILRRFIAEDPAFHLSTVPELKSLCLEHIVEHFEFNSSLIEGIKLEKQKEYVISKLSTGIPLKVAGMYLNDQDYWKKRCMEKFNRTISINEHNGSWKKAYFEILLSDAIQNFVPHQTHEGRFNEILNICAPHVSSLVIDQMLPPIKNISSTSLSLEWKKNGNDDDSDSDSEKDKGELVANHLPFETVLPRLKFLKSLKICYNVKDCGMNFEWQLFQFTGSDCLSLSTAVKEHPMITTLHLKKSRVDSDRCRILASHLLDHHTLKELDLSHNFIEDRGARALGKLLNGRSLISRLFLDNNGIRAAGCHALSYPLFKNSCLLEQLGLRMNRIQDDGAINLGKALSKSTTLKKLNIASNDIGISGINMIAQALTTNTVLSSLDLSNNRIGLEGGQKLQRALSENKTLEECDLRMCGSGQEAEYHISQITKANYNDKFLLRHMQEPVREYAIPTSFRKHSGYLAYPVPVSTNPVLDHYAN